MRRPSSITLPRRWPHHAKTALLCSLAMARTALLGARAGFEDGPLLARRLDVERDRLRAENAFLREELRIKDGRLAGIPPHRRPHYEPFERLAILCLRSAAGWNSAETARRFFVAPATIALWTRRLDEGGSAALVQAPEPVNRFPDLVAQLVKSLKATLPAMGKVRIAQVLARAGVRLAPTTAARLLRKTVPHTPTLRAIRFGGAPQEPDAKNPTRAVTARYSHHLWHLDLTVVPTGAGFWIPWCPFSLPTVWPFSWTVAVVVDHFSRAVVAHAVFRQQPGAEAVCALLDRAILDAGRTPRHLVTDRGVQFRQVYLGWCKRRRVRPRFGAVGKKGSIAVVERFIRSMKDECFRVIAVPLRPAAIRADLAAYVEWYNTARPHSSLGGETPQDRLRGPARVRNPPAFEVRPSYPLGRGKRRRRRPRGQVVLVVDHVHGREHLPVFSLRDAA